MSEAAIQKYKVTAEDIVRIEVIERPLQKKPGEGLYEWRHVETRFYADIMTLERELNGLGGIFKEKCESILDRLQNMHKIYLNLRTGEMST